MLKNMWDDYRGLEESEFGPPKEKKVGIVVTDEALKKIESMCDENGMVGVRPYVFGGGCSGMQHSMPFVDTIEERDTEVAPYVYVDPVAYQFM